MHHKDLSLPVCPDFTPLHAAGSRVPSIDDVLQDGSPQHHGCSQPVPPADIYLPGNSTKPVLTFGQSLPLSLREQEKGNLRDLLYPLRAQVLSGAELYPANPHSMGQAHLVCLLASCWPRLFPTEINFAQGRQDKLLKLKG